MTYGDWAQWRRRLKKERGAGYVTCPKHHAAASCSCLANELALQQWAKTLGSAGTLTIKQAAERAAGLVPES